MKTHSHSVRALQGGAALALLVGMVALAMPPRGRDGMPITWDTLLAPGAEGGALPTGFRIADIRRGYGENDVVVSVAAPDGSTGVEIHILPRGCWDGALESSSFGIAYETPHSPAAERMAVRQAIGARVAARDHGLPPPDAIPLRSGFEAITLRSALRDWSGGLFLLGAVLFVSLPFLRSPAALLGACGIGVLSGLARASGILFNGQATCPTGPATAIDLGVRFIQALWLLLILSAPALCWRAGRASGIGGRRLLLVVGATVLLALTAVWNRGDEPLHANAHAWREAREVLIPWHGRSTDTEPFLHGRAAPALAWLLADAEHAVRGTVNPFRISRVAGAAAAGACALLVAVIIGSAAAGFATGAALALMPLAQTYAVSGSALTVSAWLLPWSLGLLVAAATSGDRVLLAGAALAGVLGSQSHTAMLTLLPALVVGWWLLAAPSVRSGRVAIAAAILVAAAWMNELLNSYRMLAMRNESTPIGLLGAAALGVSECNLFLDPQWVSPLLVPLALVGVVAGARHFGLRRLAVPVVALLLTAAPFFAVIQCSSDAVRYQGTLLGLLTSLAVIGAWAVTASARLGSALRTAIRLALLAGFIALPLPSGRAPADPAVVEHHLVEEAVSRMQPGTLIVLPHATERTVIFDFPDFLLPQGSRVAFAGDPRIASHRGPRLLYLGLACISSDEGLEDPSGMRAECRDLRTQAQPWAVRSLQAGELPHHRGGAPWTFHHLASGVPFGFFTQTADRVAQ